jgi:hypothetical protein
MKRIMEVIECVQFAIISPDGFPRQFDEWNMLANAPSGRKFFVAGTDENALLCRAIKEAVLITCDVLPLHSGGRKAIEVKCTFQGNGKMFAFIEFAFYEDGAEVCCFVKPMFEHAA